MNVIHLDRRWAEKILKSSPITPQEKSKLLTNYALKDFRIELSDGTWLDLWIDDINLQDYGTHEAIYIRTPEDKENQWTAMLVSDTDLARNFYEKGLVIENLHGHLEAVWFRKESLSMFVIWLFINRDILKKYKTVVKIGKRRHQIQDMGEKRANAYHQKPIKISDGISYTWEYENPRSFSRHCEAWGVRGHYRHYKNGKVIFIKPYVKGSGRLKDSLYELN